MNELPSSWVAADLLDIAELIRGVTYRKPDARKEPFDGSIPVLRANNIQNRIFSFRDLVHVPAGLVSEAQQVKSGDVVIATSSGSISVVRKAAQARDDLQAGFGAFCGVLRPTTTIEARYFGYFFSTDEYRTEVSSMARGVNINNLKRDHFAALSLPLAPCNEQNRIADKLDTVLVRVDAYRERLDRVPAILKRFRQAVLSAATTGKLTEEWREEYDEDLTSSTVGQMIDRIEAGVNVKCDERPPNDGERGLVKISAITWGTYDDDKSKTLPASKHVPEATRIQVDDFLISRANTLELVGACVIVGKVTRPVFLSDKVLRLVMPDSIKKWVLFVLQSESGRRQIEKLASGNQLSMRNLSQKSLRSIVVPIPGHKERAEIVRRVESLFAYADRLEARYTTARTQVERLTPALLAKAFRGELVPQDPNDEPAAVLLERIRAARAAEPAKTKRRKPGRKPKMTKPTTESVKTTIQQLPEDRFTFDELRNHASADYETLKDIVFALLSEAQPPLTQVFNTEAQAMQFVRVKQ